MTLDEIKLAVCKRLPELLFEQGGQYYWKPQKDYSCRTHHPINWPTEGLQVCHEAEKLMDDKQWSDYVYYVCENIRHAQPKELKGSIHATYEQRLEALFRVWFPERF